MKTLNDETLKRVREFNIAYQQEHGITPSYRQIMNALKLGSLATVRRYVMELENQGILKRSEIGKIIPMPKLKKGNFVLAPLIGSIVCGIPNPSEENYEDTYALPTDIFGKSHLFMLHAEGNSMIEAGISPGDLLVLRKQDSADDGEIVVALVDGETTLKRLHHRDGKIVLHPENKRMKDIIVDDCNVQGVLVSCIKKY
jgi:repressor LexA